MAKSQINMTGSVLLNSKYEFLLYLIHVIQSRGGAFICTRKNKLVRSSESVMKPPYIHINIIMIHFIYQGCT